LEVCLSIVPEAVLDYLKQVDEPAYREALKRYATLGTFADDDEGSFEYARAVLTGEVPLGLWSIFFFFGRGAYVP
jgi:hypothetical protein